MSATKAKRGPEIMLAKKIMELVNSADFAGALALAQKGALEFPEFLVPAGAGNAMPTFAQLATAFGVKLAKVQAPEPVKAPEPVIPLEIPQVEPVKVETATLRIVHRADAPTSIFGVEKDSPAHLTIGSKKRGGQGWIWWAPTLAFYVPRSKGYAADMGKIDMAVEALEALRQDGVQLYRVETDIATKDSEGNALPVRRTAEQLRAWQRAYDGALNVLAWAFKQGTQACATCPVTGLTMRTGSITKDAEGMPRAQCYTCTGDPAPAPEPVKAPKRIPLEIPQAEPEFVFDLAAVMALPAEPSPVVPMANCGSCRQLVAVVNGQLESHNRSPFGQGGACRGRLGVVVADVEPEPAAPKERAAKKAAPVVQVQEQEQAPESVIGLAWKFKLADGAKGRQTATELRSDLARRVLPVNHVAGVGGLRLEVRLDKAARTLVVTVMEAPEGVRVDVAKLALQVKGTALTVRGVAKLGRV